MQEARVILITGASSGIGAAAACQLARLESTRVLLLARRRQRLEGLAKKIRDAGGDVDLITADLAEKGAYEQVRTHIQQEHGRLDVLINNAGLFAVRHLSESDAQHVDAVLDLNIRAPITLTHALLPFLLAAGERASGGHIINVSSVAASSVFPGCGVYAASKAALDQWSAVIREELRERGVRVGVLAPGPTDTEAWDDKDVSRERMVCSEDIAQAIEYILTQQAAVSIDKIVVTPRLRALG